MIVDKKDKRVLSGNKSGVLASANTSDKDQLPMEIPEQIASNGPIDVLYAMKEILRGVTWEYGVEGSPKIFRTVQIDDGQYERIINTKQNKEETMGFPAAFVHFINWHYLVQQARINEGRATLRIRFILNSINVHEDGHDVDVYRVAELIHQAIQENIPNYPCLQERCRLEYIDPMESFNHGLQPCWMTYEVYFRQTNIWITRNKIYKRFVCPPFTNHADQDPNLGDNNSMSHNNLDHPRTPDEATEYKD